MVLRPIVSVIKGTGAPEKTESLLVNASVTQLMEAHVHRFRAYGLDTAICDSLSGRVVRKDGSGGPADAHLGKNISYLNRF